MFILNKLRSKELKFFNDFLFDNHGERNATVYILYGTFRQKLLAFLPQSQRKSKQN